MKKILLVMFAVFSVFTLIGCSSSNQSLSYNEKYILSSKYPLDETNTSYYIFKDGYAEYHYSNTDDNYLTGKIIYDYVIKYTYEMIEDTVVLLYDSVSFGSRNTTSFSPSTTSTPVLGFSVNFLISTSGSVYIREGYLANNPNFGNEK